VVVGVNSLVLRVQLFIDVGCCWDMGCGGVWHRDDQVEAGTILGKVNLSLEGKSGRKEIMNLFVIITLSVVFVYF